MDLMSAEDKLSSIINNWFMNEPLLFNTYCTHRLEKNDDMLLMFRTGNGILQYNSKLVAAFSVGEVEERLKGEIYRILLKHPYERMPDLPNFVALSRASDTILSEYLPDTYKSAEEYELQFSLCYEEYYEKFKLFCASNEEMMNKRFKERLPSEEDLKDEKNKKNAKEIMESQEAEYEKSALWNENEQILKSVKNEILKAQKTGSWGSIPGDLIEEIQATLEVQVDYKRMLSLFHVTILSEKRKLTRMRPNRRYEEYMGSKYDLKIKLLIAVDDSGSITNEELCRFLSVVNRIFRYGVEEIRVITFDEIVQDEFDVSKAKSRFKIHGRGGTNFNAPIDYCKKHPEFDGLMIFTDGYGAFPKLERSMKIMWVFTNKQTYDDSKDTIKGLKGSKGCWVRL